MRPIVAAFAALGRGAILPVMSRLLPLCVGLLAGLTLSACAGEDGGDSDLGRPCAYDGDCGGGLICDFHMGLGTCQEKHSHSGSSSSSSTG